jgi:hypothetical protein
MSRVLSETQAVVQADEQVPRIAAVEMAAFALLLPSEPRSEMAGFAFPAKRKYRPAVSRLIPSPRAILLETILDRAKLYIVVCRLTLRTFDMP